MKALKVLLYLLGFPLMIAAVVVVSLPIFEAGKTYGIMVFAGVAVVAVLGLLYFITGLITWSVSRKAKTVTAIRKATAALVIVSAVLTTGLWFAVDKALPDILDDATSGTITYDDIREDYLRAAEYHGLLLTKFIEMNCDNGNLDNSKRAQYLAEGYQNEEVQNLIHTNYKSMNEDGYESFVGPWLDLAVDGRMTIPTIVHLVINDRVESTEDPTVDDLIFIYQGEGRGEEHGTDPIKWTILDMQEGTLDFAFDLGSFGGILAPFSDGIEDYLEDILAALNTAIADPALAGSFIEIGVNIIDAKEAAADPSLNKGSIQLSIISASESRGVWDYMHMAWLDSNNLLFAVISLFPARRIMLFFGGLLIILSLMIGAIRERQYGAKFLTAAKTETAPAVAAKDNKFSSPYLDIVCNSFEVVESRVNKIVPRTAYTYTKKY